MSRIKTSSRSLRALLLAAACTLLPQTAAAADSLGNAGYVQDILLNSSKSDVYMQYQGAVSLLEGDTVSAARREYRWGGSVCSGIVPSDEQVRYLFEAMRAGKSLQIVPSYKLGAGGARCLVALKIRLRPVMQINAAP